MSNTKKGLTQRVFTALKVCIQWVFGVLAVFLMIGCLMAHSLWVDLYVPKPTPKPVSLTTKRLTAKPVHTDAVAILPKALESTPLKPPSLAPVSPPSFTAYDVALSPDLQAYLWEQCQSYGLDFTLLLAMMEQESGYQDDVVSTTQDYGLLQINKVNHPRLTKEMGTTDFLDPRQNIDAGLFMLGEIFEKEQDEHRALMIYNCGATGAKRLWDRGIYSTAYTDKILDKRAEIFAMHEGR